jgi:phosphonate transport system substrate-binding protein
MPARERRAVVCLGLLVSLLTTALPAWAQQVLRIGAIPDQNPERLNRLYGVLAKQLTGVQARLQTPGAKVLAQRDIDAKFRSVFIANSASGLQPLSSQKQLTTLRGKRFTFGSESSTSGRLMPQYFLQQAGVSPSQFAGGRAGFSKSHDATIALVQSGSYQAGALNEQVWSSAVKEGRVDTGKVRVIWRTPTYVDYHWVVRPGLDQRFGKGFTTRLQKALLNIDRTTANGKTILELFAAGSFIPATDSQYQSIEQVGRQLGKIR